ncbi:4-alpha-glucanotransferase [Rheinheimera sp. YQF-2]|uniref:4-alpha-glucanotransferase n=1 Tax=Rheinheimera lutimaris TaxID=2740584 RepID=A0A7Y5EGU5_9GAMM|nr:4-alpha-glucanotransferase [Rheinheimera lutimaris]NRQ41729.1 4-alpha-glucanotransferase [Rheinheimera lutimaris]
MELIKQLAALAGLQDSYVHAQGHTEHVSLEKQQAILAAMGFDLSSDNSIQQHIAALTEQPWLEVIAPVTVCRQGELLRFRLQQLQHEAISDWQWHIVTEEQQQFSGNITIAAKDIVEQRTTGKGEILAAELTLELSLPLGYHQLSLSNGTQSYQQQLIITPQRCFQLHDKAVLHKTFGPAIQLYALKSQRNWGIGDFIDLQQMIAPLAAQGCDFIGLNPLHALYPELPQDCSPYSPNSRLWLNTEYVALEHTEEYRECAAAQQRFATENFQQRLQQLRNCSDVDYIGVAALKKDISVLLFQQFKQQHLAKNTPRAAEFQRFVSDSGISLHQLAIHQVLQGELFARDWSMAAWQNFPPELRDPNSSAVAAFAREHTDAIQRQLYLQWQAQLQLADVKRLCQQHGMAIGLYCDVAVGTSRSSAESWGAPEDYLLDLSVGAPADIMAPKGQNWGLLAYNPQTLRQKAYRPFIELIQANMRYAGALRLDHVMALLRLWCCPIGADATAGTYIRFPAADLFAILALESQRNSCVVIGEDLGTVPVEISHLMAQYQVLSYRVFMLEQKAGSYDHAAQTYPELALATVSTHDMPTLVGYWQEHDLALRHKLDLFPNPQVADSLYQLRADEKRLMAERLQLSDGDYAQLVQASHLFTAQQPAKLLAFQLEDLLLMHTPVNIPGTSTEYPNWRRKLEHNIDEILTRPDVLTLLAAIKTARQ